MISPMKIKGALAAVNAFKHAVSGNVVSPKEVARRLNVCKTLNGGKPCPWYKNKGGFITSASKALGTAANKHRVPGEISDKSCGVCGCSMMLLLPATDRHLHKDSPEEAANRPDGCWILTNKPKTD